MLIDDSELDERQRSEKAGMYRQTKLLISKFCLDQGINDSAREQMVFLSHSAIYGATQMLGSGEMENTPESYAMIRACLERIFS